VATAAGPRRIPSFFLYGEAPRADDEPVLHVETIEVRSGPRHWKISPHVHRRLHQLILALGGRGVSLMESAAIEYVSPALVVVPAGAVHGFDFEPGTEGFVVSMTDDLPREIGRRDARIAGLFESPMTLELRSEAAAVGDLRRCFEMLLAEFERARAGRALALEGLLKTILALVLRVADVCGQSVEEGAGTHRRLVSRFRELVERDFAENRSLSDYASALNVSQSRLRNACLNVTDQSPMQIVHARILLEAKRELLYTSKSVSEIAYAIGFEDPAYFTRFFSQRTGSSPSRFRSGGVPGEAARSLAPVGAQHGSHTRGEP